MILDTKRKKIIYIFALIILSLLFSGYYYGIQITFTPDAEALESLFLGLECLNNGGTPPFKYRLLAYVCYWYARIWGISFTTIRMAYTTFYFCYVISSLDIVLRDNFNKVKWSVLPFYILFFVMLPVQLTRAWGWLGNGWEQYPLNQHPETMICAFFGIWMIYRINSDMSIIKKRICILILTLWSLYWGTSGDSLILLVFIIPEIMLFVATLRKSEKKQDFEMKLLSGGIIGFLLLRLLSTKINFLQNFFLTSDYAITIELVKNSTWDSISGLCTSIFNYIAIILGMFGCDFTEYNVYNVSIVFCILKIAFIIFIFKIVSANLRVREDNYLQFILSWAIVILSVVWILSTWSYTIMHTVRDIVIILPYGTILLCLNIDRIGEYLQKKRIGTYRSLVCTMCCVLIATFPYGEWANTEEDIYQQEYREVYETVQKLGLHTGVWCQSYNLGNCVYILSSGEYSLQRGYFAEQGTEIVLDGQEDVLYDYLIFEANKADGVWVGPECGMNYARVYPPDETIELCNGTVQLYVYRNGLVYTKG